MSLPTRAPAQFTAGETVSWTLRASVLGTELDPADGWTVVYHYASHAAKREVTGTDNGDGQFLFTLTTTDTIEWAPVDYAYQAFATLANFAYCVDKGQCTVLQSLAGPHAVDTRSWAVKALEAVEATLLGNADHNQQSFSIEGRTVAYMTPGELMDWRQRLEQEVRSLKAAERMSKGLANPNQIRVRF